MRSFGDQTPGAFPGCLPRLFVASLNSMDLTPKLRHSQLAHPAGKGTASGKETSGTVPQGIRKMAVERPHFVAAVTHAVGKLIPVAGGVLVKDQSGKIIGAVGVSGDISDNDEIAALAGIKAAKLVGDPGSD